MPRVARSFPFFGICCFSAIQEFDRRRSMGLIHLGLGGCRPRSLKYQGHSFVLGSNFWSPAWMTGKEQRSCSMAYFSAAVTVVQKQRLRFGFPNMTFRIDLGIKSIFMLTVISYQDHYDPLGRRFWIRKCRNVVCYCLRWYSIMLSPLCELPPDKILRVSLSLPLLALQKVRIWTKWSSSTYLFDAQLPLILAPANPAQSEAQRLSIWSAHYCLDIAWMYVWG
jgi:hypothetical protein